eukprot:541381-Pyramimonas_sp.AAC.1
MLHSKHHCNATQHRLLEHSSCATNCVARFRSPGGRTLKICSAQNHAIVANMITFVDFARIPSMCIPYNCTARNNELRREAQPHVRVYSHDGPIRRMKRGYILAMDQSK